jgi:hypothetical protein
MLTDDKIEVIDQIIGTQALQKKGLMQRTLVYFKGIGHN